MTECIEHDSHPENEVHQGEEAEITIDSKKVLVHEGRLTVSQLKQAGGIALAYELAQLLDGKLVALSDDSTVTIEGGEEFVSYPKTGTAS